MNDVFPIASLLEAAGVPLGSLDTTENAQVAEFVAGVGNTSETRRASGVLLLVEITYSGEDSLR